MGKWETNNDPNGVEMNLSSDVMPIGMHKQNQNPYEPFSTGSKMRRGKEPQIFDNNGSTSKGDGGGTINHNGEYGPVTYGF